MVGDRSSKDARCRKPSTMAKANIIVGGSAFDIVRGDEGIGIIK